jgi:hypothetical protein
VTMSPAENSARASIAAHTRWSRETDRSAATEAARSSFLARFERQVDPDGVLTPTERAFRAEHARKAYMASLAFKARKKQRATKT